MLPPKTMAQQALHTCAQANSSMRHGDGAAVQFIDFEYSCPMQRGFDWVGRRKILSTYAHEDQPVSR